MLLAGSKMVEANGIEPHSAALLRVVTVRRFGNLTGVSHLVPVVEANGIEPMTYGLQSRRSPS